jgi:hypothetical protein
LPFVFAQAVLVTASGTGEFADAFQRTLFPVGTVRSPIWRRPRRFPTRTWYSFPRTPKSAASRSRRSSSFETLAEALPSRRRAGERVHLIVAGRSNEDIRAVIQTLGDVDALAGPGLVVSID